MRPIWHNDVARHLEEAAGFLRSAQSVNARAAMGTAVAYLLRAAGDGDEEAFKLLSSIREGIEQAEPTQRLKWEIHKP